MTRRRICIGRNFYQIKRLLIGHFKCILNRINTYFYIIANQPYLRHSYHMVCAMFLLLFFSETGIEIVSPLEWRFLWKCHLRFLK